MKKLFISALAVLALATYAAAETGVMPIDLNGRSLAGGAFSGIFSVTPGTKGTASVSATGKTGLHYKCTTGATSATAVAVKTGRNESLSTYYNSSEGTLWFGAGTGTTHVTFGSYSTANQNVCAGYYW